MSLLHRSQVTGLQERLQVQTDRSDSQSEQLSTTRTRLQELESQSEEKTKSIDSLTWEIERLRCSVKV